VKKVIYSDFLIIYLGLKHLLCSMHLLLSSNVQVKSYRFVMTQQWVDNAWIKFFVWTIHFNIWQVWQMKCFYSYNQCSVTTALGDLWWTLRERMWRILMWNQSCVKERETEKERCAWAGNKQTFFQYSRKSNSNIFALMVLLVTTVVMHSTSHTFYDTHTHRERERNKDRDILNSPQFKQSTMQYPKQTNK